MLYFDNASTTKPTKEVIEFVYQQMQDIFANPSSTYKLGVKSYLLLEEARTKLAALYNIKPRGVIFCSSGTESDNLAIKGVMQKYTSGNIVVSPLEHAAIQETTAFLQKQGFEIRVLSVSPTTGQVDLADLRSKLDKNTRIVSVLHVHNETGICQDLKAIHDVIQEADTHALFHSDGVQACGKIKINLEELGVDLYSISSHKVHSLRGAGALLMRQKFDLVPLIHGGNQEYGLRSGTENLLAITAMIKSLSLLVEKQQEDTKTVQDFRDAFLEELTKVLPTTKALLFENQIPHVLSLNIPPVRGEVLLHHLETEGIYISTGSACHAKCSDLSTGLTALHLTTEEIRGNIRLSFSADTLPPITEVPHIASLFKKQYDIITS